MDDFLLGVFAFILSVLVGLGIIFILMDFRYFDAIQKQCEKQGYIQNYTTRITCKVEVQQ